MKHKKHINWAQRLTVVLLAALLIAALPAGCTEKDPGPSLSQPPVIITAPGEVQAFAKDVMSEHLAITKLTSEGRSEECSTLLTGLEIIETGTAGLDFSVEVYRLEYDLTEANKMFLRTNETVRYLVVLWNGLENAEFIRLGVLTNEMLEKEYSTPEMQEEYGGAFVAAAMELYGKWLEGAASYKDVTKQNGYTITAQRRHEYTIVIPKEKLPDSIYTTERHTFEEDEVVVYETDTTTVWLESVQLSNESVEQLYFKFDFSYRDLPENGTILSTYCVSKDGTTTGHSDLSWISVTDDIGAHYPRAATLRGQGPGESITYYVETAAVRAAEGSIRFDSWCFEAEYKKGAHKFGAYSPADNVDNSSKDAGFLEFEDINDLIAAVSSVENSIGTQSVPKDTIDDLRDAKISSRLPVPYYKNAEFPLRNASNLSNIILETSSVFGYPMIWYYGKIDGVNVIVSAGVVPSEVVAQVDGEGIIKLKELHAEILKTLPTNPEPAEIRESISSMNIGGENLTAFITQYSDDPRCHIELLIEDIYVKISAYPETMNGGVLSDISIQIVSVE